MASGLIWSERALDDLDEIVEYIAKDSVTYARNVARNCFARVDGLVDHPRQGRKVPEYEGERELREVFVHSWRLIYEVASDQIVVVTVIHGARLIKNVDPL